jgi:BirA family biotin operon repressor/biotin-[acetyl-CoA-carboxylase] ligase
MIPADTVSQVGTAMWRLYTCDSVGSTADLARSLPPWNAVIARTQTAGRGRFGRTFVSDEGGLWISAVLPAGGDPARWLGFSLLAGAHLLQMLRQLGLPHARLRWPNDLMAGEKKLAGILVEQGSRQTLSVGLGLNVLNEPWSTRPDLVGHATRLADLIARPPALPDLAILVLDALADAHSTMQEGGLPAAVNAFNASHPPRAVTIQQANGPSLTGTFLALDPAGNLLLSHGGGQQTIPHTSVEHLIEN